MKRTNCIVDLLLIITFEYDPCYELWLWFMNIYTKLIAFSTNIINIIYDECWKQQRMYPQQVKTHSTAWPATSARNKPTKKGNHANSTLIQTEVNYSRNTTLQGKTSRTKNNEMATILLSPMGDSQSFFILPVSDLILFGGGGGTVYVFYLPGKRIDCRNLWSTYASQPHYQKLLKIYCM